MTGEILMIRIVNAITGVIAFILGIYILLQLLGAGVSAPVVSWLYSMGGNLSAPFRGIFGNIVLSGSSILDVSAAIALFVYSLVGTLLVTLIKSVFARTDRHHAHTTHVEES